MISMPEVVVDVIIRAAEASQGGHSSIDSEKRVPLGFSRVPTQ
jgi:hypothetical protein